MDKNAVAPYAWWGMGFSFVEFGTVTPLPQEGNTKPRMFRVPEQQAVINRMGFNNHGAAAVAERLERQRQRGLRPPFPHGLSIGKNKDTPDEAITDDYAQAAALLAPHADFLTINVSSPNTPGLRALQTPAWLTKLVTVVRQARPARPVLVKVAPELDGAVLHQALDAVLAAGASGIIATNTLGTTAPNGLPAGLSGPPLRGLARQRVAAIRQQIGDGPTIIGVGGIATASDAQAMLDAGANLLQVYTALVYAGPTLVQQLSRLHCATRY
jgi:dihydroorotate dehydrogenase